MTRFFITFCFIARLFYFKYKTNSLVNSKEPYLLYLPKEVQDKEKYNNHKSIVKKLFKEIFIGIHFKFLYNPNDNYVNEMDLFYWCILSNRINIAKTFWRLGKVNIFYFLN